MKEIQVISSNPGMTGIIALRDNVIFAQPDGIRLSMNILAPQWKPTGNGFPLVVFIQGSGWTKPNQMWQMPQLSRLAARGFVVASVTHRSAYEAKAPAFLQDVKTAIRYLRAHASEYGIDKERVCAWGTSSGGNTALLLALTGDDPSYDTDEWRGESTKVQAVVDCFGPTDLVRMMDVQYKDRTTPGDEALFKALAGGVDADSCREPVRAISPYHLLKPDMSLPPMLMLHGDADDIVLYEDSAAMYEKLVQYGYDAELVRVTDAPHEGSFWSPQTLEIIFDYICDKLG